MFIQLLACIRHTCCPATSMHQVDRPWLQSISNHTCPWFPSRLLRIPSWRWYVCCDSPHYSRDRLVGVGEGLRRWGARRSTGSPGDVELGGGSRRRSSPSPWSGRLRPGQSGWRAWGEDLAEQSCSRRLSRMMWLTSSRYPRSPSTTPRTGIECAIVAEPRIIYRGTIRLF